MTAVCDPAACKLLPCGGGRAWGPEDLCASSPPQGHWCLSGGERSKINKHVVRLGTAWILLLHALIAGSPKYPSPLIVHFHVRVPMEPTRRQRQQLSFWSPAALLFCEIYNEGGEPHPFPLT